MFLKKMNDLKLLIVGLMVCLLCLGCSTTGIAASGPDSLSAQLEAVAAEDMPSIVGILAITEEDRGGLGTGFFISEDGYLLTNFHVIDGHEVFIVETSDGRIYRDVMVVGGDPVTDLAVLKVNAKTPFRALAFGDSDKLRPGQIVCAIGHGNAHKDAVTMGIVSARREQLPSNMMQSMDMTYLDLIQTDVSINHGNSGGPLLNLSGECVGVNSLGDVNFRTGEDSWQGVSYSIAGNFAREIAGRIIQDGGVNRVWFGVGSQDLDGELKEAFELPSDVQGAVVTNVETESPAALGGLIPGDVIVSFGGKPVVSAQHLRNRASLAMPKPVKLQILRHGDPRSLTITPELIQDLEPVLIERMELMLEGGPEDQPRPDGLQIVDISNHSPFLYINAFSNRKGAGSCGLNSEEWLLELNGTVLDSISALRKTLASLKSGERVLFRVRGRNGEIRFVTGILP